MGESFHKNYEKNAIICPISVDNLITVYRFDHTLPKSISESHDFPELIYVEEGEYNVLLDGREDISLHSGEMIIYAPNMLHGDSAKGLINCTFYVMSFETSEPILNDIFNKVFKLSAKQRMYISDVFTSALQLNRSRVKKQNTNGMSLNGEENTYLFQKIKCNLELLLIELCENEKKGSTSVTSSNSYNIKSNEFINISEFLRKNITKSLTIKDIADEFSMSVSKVKKIFYQDRSGGIMNYFNDLKIAEAKRLITKSSMNFTEISEHLGFNSVTYFSSVFKKRTGSTPSEYAKKIDKR